VSPAVTEDRVLHYRADGGLADTFGERGQGPGEFAAMPGPVVIGPDDAVHVFDYFERSLSTFDLDGSFQRKRQLMISAEQALFLADGSLVAYGVSLTAERIGLPAHLVDVETGEVTSFGSSETLIDPRVEYKQMRRMGPAGEHSVWLAHVNRYEAEEWSVDGTHKRTVVRDVDWFRSWPPDISLGNPKYVEPKPFTRAVWQDENGLLWVVVRVAASDWSAEDAPPVDADRPMPAAYERNAYYDIVIEAIDPGTASVVAAARVPHLYPQGDAGPGLLVARSSDDTGTTYVDIWQVTLEGWPSGR